MNDLVRRDPAFSPDDDDWHNQTMHAGAGCDAFREDLEHWDDKAQLGGMLEAFAAARAALGPGHPEREADLYAAFTKRAMDVDWCCLCEAQELVFAKLERLVEAGQSACAWEPERYLNMLRELFSFDDEEDDAGPRFERHLAFYSDGSPLRTGYRGALEEILSVYKMEKAKTQELWTFEGLMEECQTQRAAQELVAIREVLRCSRGAGAARDAEGEFLLYAAFVEKAAGLGSRGWAAGQELMLNKLRALCAQQISVTDLEPRAYLTLLFGLLSADAEPGPTRRRFEKYLPDFSGEGPVAAGYRCTLAKLLRQFEAGELAE